LKHHLYRWIQLALCLFLWHSPLHPTENDINSIDNIFDDVGSFEEEMFIDSFLETVSFDNLAHRAIPVESILGLLEAAGAFAILEDDFYRRTNPFIIRPLVDLPMWELHGCQDPHHWIVGAQLFYSSVDRSIFTCNNTNIKSYLNLEQEFLFEKLNELTPQIKNLFPNASLVDNLLDTTNIKNLISLFENFTVQQRRTGVMMQAWRQWKSAEIRMLLPLYYLERNIFLRPEEESIWRAGS
jgi:hypothetical protein